MIMNETRTTLYTTMFENCGQCPIELADKAIERLNKQFPDLKWRKDFSDEMYVMDETDERMSNPSILLNGHCWITCSKTDREMMDELLDDKFD